MVSCFPAAAAAAYCTQSWNSSLTLLCLFILTSVKEPFLRPEDLSCMFILEINLLALLSEPHVKMKQVESGVGILV